MTKEIIKKAMQVLVDNGIEKDEAFNVLQALCYVLMDIEIEEYYDESIENNLDTCAYKSKSRNDLFK